MNPKHCVSLEIAKQLKEAGYNQRGECWWFISPMSDPIIVSANPLLGHSEEAYVAPLATEILEELPFGLEGENGNDILKIERYKNGYSVCYFDDGQDKYTGKTHLLKMSDTLPNALAKLWLYLKKGGIER